MDFLKKLFSDPSQKEHYIATWEVNLSDLEQLEGLLQTLVVSKSTAQALPNYTQLKYDNTGQLSTAAIYSEGKLETNANINKRLELDKEKSTIMYREVPIHNIYQFEEDSRGLHQLGGDMPTNFILPNNKLAAPTLYFGYINNQDAIFNWLPFTIHLVCPIHLDFMAVYMDYSNPLAPIIINSDILETVGTAYDDFTPDSKIVYNSIKFSAHQTTQHPHGLGGSGIPSWIQGPELPRCPKTNRLMRFVCQLEGGVNAKYNNVIASEDYYAQYYDELNFWGDGILYLFFEPSSKTACYIIQNS